MRAAASLLLAALLCLAGQAHADDTGKPSPRTTGSVTSDSIVIEAAEEGIRKGKEGQDGSVGTSKTAGFAEPGFTAGSNACQGAEAVVDGSNTDTGLTFCQQYAEPATPVLTVGLIRNAFAELELPAGTLVIQPPDGLTLVNFDTNFYTTSTQPIARTVTLLGRRVTLEATPSTYRWTFGDGESLTTSDPGAAYPDLRVTHNYLHKDTYRPSLATTYTGRYRVGGGPWRQIPGTVTINGPSRPLRAIEAEPKLVSY